MFGIEMMLKSMGLDPETIQKQVGDFGKIIIDLKEQMNRIEAKLDAILNGGTSAAPADAGIVLLEKQEAE